MSGDGLKKFQEAIISNTYSSNPNEVDRYTSSPAIANIETTTTILCDPVSPLNFIRSMHLAINMIAMVITMEITAKTICDIRNRILLFDQ